ncbi:hypothetical protein J2853_004697 [Streptosporangium lutulentum]|uniref:Uncharacterized protein n=1 Tax=Streptosporangium lutulentum TaxID=1461250 RepID=A0ABT9QFE1_9ACTN|nr:hypothetical protein [Streptosporangium lutulentum]
MNRNWCVRTKSGNIAVKEIQDMDATRDAFQRLVTTALAPRSSRFPSLNPLHSAGGGYS